MLLHIVYGIYFCIMALFIVNVNNYCNMALTIVMEHLWEQPCKQRYKDYADEGYPSAGHELLHALALARRVVLAVAFQ